MERAVIYLFFLFNFSQKGKEGERKGEKHQCVVAGHAPAPTRDLACNPGCALMENQTGDPLVLRPVLNLLSHTSQGDFHIFEMASFLSADTVLDFCLPSCVMLALGLKVSGPLLPHPRK